MGFWERHFKSPKDKQFWSLLVWGSQNIIMTKLQKRYSNTYSILFKGFTSVISNVFFPGRFEILSQKFVEFLDHQNHGSSPLSIRSATATRSVAVNVRLT